MEKTVERRGNGAAKVVEVVENAARNRTESSARGGSACAINFHAELLSSRVHPRTLYPRSLSVGPVRGKLLYWTAESRR